MRKMMCVNEAQYVITHLSPPKKSKREHLLKAIELEIYGSRREIPILRLKSSRAFPLPDLSIAN